MSLVNNLKNAGLADKEAKVYLAMLELGPASVLEIAAKAGVNRPTAYLQIESLKKMGLVSTQKKGKKDLYIAESPDQLNAVLHKEEKILESRKDLLKEVLPELENLFNASGDKPVVRFFEGKEGLLRMQEEFLKAKGGEILSVSNLDDVLTLFPKHTSEYSPRRVGKKIHSRLIYTSTNGATVTDTPESLRESLFLPIDKFKFNADITVYDDVVAIASLRGKVLGALIINPDIASSFRSLIELIWSLGKSTTN